MAVPHPIAPRFPLEFPIIFSAQATSFKGQTENLSQSGLAVGFPGSVEVPKGLTLDLELELEPERLGSIKLNLKALVVWTEPGRVGLQICEMKPEQRKKYDALIDGYQTLCRGLAQLQRAG